MTLIAFEGLDQSGKATQAKRLAARLAQNGLTVHLLSFPDYLTPIGQEIAKALAGERRFAPDVMQLLYIANRFEYKPRLDLWLDAGDVVICDRYRASSVAYGEAQGLDPAWLEETQHPLPMAAVTIFLDIPPEAGVKRKSSGRDVYERDLALLGRVRESYRRQASQPDWVLIDATPDRDHVAEAVARAVLPRLERRSAPERS
jgi:dTMP kinase